MGVMPASLKPGNSRACYVEKRRRKYFHHAHTGVGQNELWVDNMLRVASREYIKTAYYTTAVCRSAGSRRVERVASNKTGVNSYKSRCLKPACRNTEIGKNERMASGRDKCPYNLSLLPLAAMRKSEAGELSWWRLKGK